MWTVGSTPGLINSYTFERLSDRDALASITMQRSLGMSFAVFVAARAGSHRKKCSSSVHSSCWIASSFAGRMMLLLGSENLAPYGKSHCFGRHKSERNFWLRQELFFESKDFNDLGDHEARPWARLGASRSSAQDIVLRTTRNTCMDKSVELFDTSIKGIPGCPDSEVPLKLRVNPL